MLASIGKSFETRSDCACTIQAREEQEREEARAAWRVICQKRSRLVGTQLGQTFDSFRPEQGSKLAYEIAKRFADSHGPPPILEGPYGVGKSHLLAAIINVAVSNGINAEFWKLGEILDLVRRSYDSEDVTNPLPLIEQSVVLCLDDVGAEKLTEWGQEQLCRLIDYRDVNRLPTAVSTNLNAQALAQHVGGRTFDRLTGQGTWVALTGKSHRRTERKQTQ